jgi:hypothetical protein
VRFHRSSQRRLCPRLSPSPASKVSSDQNSFSSVSCCYLSYTTMLRISKIQRWKLKLLTPSTQELKH